MNKRLFRSRENKIISGVCGGIAEYFDVDPTIVRLVWLLISFTWGIGVISYIVCAIIIPEKISENYIQNQDSDIFNDSINKNTSNKNKVAFGLILVVLGVVLLLRKFFFWFDFENILSIFLILAGIYILIKNKVDQ